MEGAKSSQREKFAKMSKIRRENLEVQSSGSDDDMAVAARHSSSSSSSAKSGSEDSGVVHRLTFRADPDLLEPKEKQRKKLNRNEIEKLRRDRLNAYFMELAKLVPLVMQSNKKIDKASILRLTVAYLRIYHDLVRGSKRSKLSSSWRPDLNMYENLGNLLLESFGGFLLVISKKGILIFATEAITKYLGHSLSDVLGAEVKNVIHPNDYDILMRQFEMTESDCRIKDTDDDTDVAHVPVNGQRSFCIKMLNVLDPQSTCYELMHLVGHLKRMSPVNGDNTDSTFSGIQSTSEPSVCLIAVAKLVSRQPIRELYPVMDNTSNQWITRHELDGKITYSDQRGALLTGFLPGESIGFSPYSLLHPDDIASVVAVHNLFLENGCVPLTVFRMFTKSREILYVQTNTHMVIDTWTSKPKFIISINTVLDEHDGILALEDQNRRIEDKKRCIEVAQTTCSHSPLSIDCSEDSDESSQSLHEPRLLASLSSTPSSASVDCIIPEVEEVDESTIDIIVGMKKFRIKMATNPKFDPKSPPHDFSSINMVFDTHATKDDGGKSIPTVRPSFLSTTGSSSDQGPALFRTNLQAPGDSFGASVVRMPSIEADVDHAVQPARKDADAYSGKFVNRRFSNEDIGSLADLLLQKDGTKPDSGKTTQNRDVTNTADGKHLLLRQLLVDKSQANTILGSVLAGGHDGVVQAMAQGKPRPTRARVSSLEHTPKPTDEMASFEFSQIKSLLQDRHEPTKRSPVWHQNGRNDPDYMPGVTSSSSRTGASHLANSTLPSSAALPGNTGDTGNVYRSTASQGMAASVGIPYQMSFSGMLWPENVSQVATSSSTAARFTTDKGTPGINPDSSGNVRDTLMTCVNANGLSVSQNGMCHGQQAQWRTVTSQETNMNPSSSCGAEIQSHCLREILPTNDSGIVREMECESDVVHSSATDLMSRMADADKYQFLKHLIAEQEIVYTTDISVDDATTRDARICSFEPSANSTDKLLFGQRNGTESSNLQSVYFTAPTNSLQSKQTNVDAVTLNGWCQDFGVTSDGGYDLCSTASSTLNGWMSDAVAGFDDSLFLAQQNDISDW